MSRLCKVSDLQGVGHKNCNRGLVPPDEADENARFANRGI